MNNIIFEPLKYYESEVRQRHINNLKKYFDKLVEKSGIDEEQNKQTIKIYKQKIESTHQLKKEIGKYKLFKVLTIIMAILLTPLLGLGIFLSVFIIKKKINPILNDIKKSLCTVEQKAAELLSQAWAQMKPLNALFSDNDTFRVMEETIPMWKFNDSFTNRQLSEMEQEYDYLMESNPNVSCINVISGNMCDNPFLYERKHMMNMGTFVYTGTLTISWTETYTDNDGNTRTRTETEVLKASLVKPKPYYQYETTLGFCSAAAPDLTFSRQPTHAEHLSEAQVERKIKKGEKKLQNKLRKTNKRGESFQSMANSEFEVLFGAWDRDQEVQFRLMYTPLAQNNTVDLIKSNSGYGDDFAFYKQHKYNIIRSQHAQDWQMSTSATRYKNYDVDVSRNTFMQFNEEYFKSVYFDFAPLMAVPIYCDKSISSTKKDYCDKMGIYAQSQHEAFINAMGVDKFKHPDSSTDVILKTELLFSNESVDTVNVIAHSFEKMPQIDFVPVRGGDGNIHAVPVHWIEYIPIEWHTCVEISPKTLDGGMKIFNVNIKII